MDITHILLDDSNPAHRELAIYRTGEINRIRLSDAEYKVYGRLEISAHNHTALFHFNIVAALNELPFLSETGHGLDSWDEAILYHGSLKKLLEILDGYTQKKDFGEEEKTLLGWQDKPAAVAYWRKIEPQRFLAFLRELHAFVAESIEKGYDLEFIL